MRALVFLLVLVNLLFFIFARGYMGNSENPDAVRVKQQLQPERIVLVSKGEGAEAEAKPAEPAPPEAEQSAAPNQEAGEAPDSAGASAKEEKKAPEKKTDDKKPEDKKPADKKAEDKKGEDKKGEDKKGEDKKAEEKKNACLAWPGLPVADADRLTALAKKKYPTLSLSRSNGAAEGGANWIYIPPLASKAEAERKAGELKKLGVTDFFIVTEAGANQYAISLGLFSSEQGAKDFLDSLKSQGVRSARLGQRGGKVSSVNVEVRGDADQIRALKEAGTGMSATPTGCDGKAAKKH